MRENEDEGGRKQGECKRMEGARGRMQVLSVIWSEIMAWQ